MLQYVTVCSLAGKFKYTEISAHILHGDIDDGFALRTEPVLLLRLINQYTHLGLSGDGNRLPFLLSFLNVL